MTKLKVKNSQVREIMTSLAALRSADIPLKISFLLDKNYRKLVPINKQITERLTDLYNRTACTQGEGYKINGFGRVMAKSELSEMEQEEYESLTKEEQKRLREDHDKKQKELNELVDSLDNEDVEIEVEQLALSRFPSSIPRRRKREGDQVIEIDFAEYRFPLYNVILIDDKKEEEKPAKPKKEKARAE